MEINTFDNLNLNEDLLKGVYLYGFTQPSKIQINGIESINTGNDCLLQSQSGTGKTATYLLGILNRICNIINNNGIIITPTRELSLQVHNVAINLSKFINFKISLCIGGTNINTTINDIKDASLIIGTLGRINHMITLKKINLNKIKFIILDEADEILLSDNINNNLENIFKEKNNYQIILISATMSINVFNFSKKYMNKPIQILLKNNEIIVDLISQFYLDVELEEKKFDTLLDLYNLVSTSQTIIFCNSIKKIEWLENNLKENNFSITVIHSNMTQDERNEIIKEFRDGNTRLLLTSDLLSRGIDIPQVNMIINYDIPNNKETYVHRIGRCGRFNKKGIAITLIKSKDFNDMKIFDRLKNFYNIDIKELPDTIDNLL
jgi:superfamily II DNA/RNA helicase